MNLTLYGYSRCGTCRDAQKWLIRHGAEPEFVDITVNPLPGQEVRRLVEQSGEGIRKFFNISGNVYREMGLKDKLAGMNEDEMIRLLAENPMLLKRPVVTDGVKATVGFKEDTFIREWAAGSSNDEAKA